MMMNSREAVVDYMTPLGLHHLMAAGHHYGPAPWVDGGPRADWTPVYYHRADAQGIGFDRTASGSNAVAQYAAPVAAQFGDLKRVPEDYLLWFHHVPWDYRMHSGRTLWDELVYRYTRGVDVVREMRKTWDELAPLVDARASRAGRRVPAHPGEGSEVVARRVHRLLPDLLAAADSVRAIRRREHSLDYYKSLEFPYAPGHH